MTDWRLPGLTYAYRVYLRLPALTLDLAHCACLTNFFQTKSKSRHRWTITG